MTEIQFKKLKDAIFFLGDWFKNNKKIMQVGALFDYIFFFCFTKEKDVQR